MFRLRNPSPSETQSRFLAGYLAALAGFVNAAGFVLVGIFTSHVTGNVGRLATDVASHQLGAASSALTMVLAFFLGAFLASLFVESSLFTHKESAIAMVLLAEAALLIGFVRLPPLAAVLCAAMGMQNSLITRISGAVVRTTHLTGVVTDLGIEAAHWLRWWSRSTPSAATLPAAGKPDAQKAALLSIIIVAFLGGGLVGAAGVLRFERQVMALPALGLVLCALYAVRSGRRG